MKTRQGFSMVEILMATVILVLALVPIMNQLNTTHRIGISAQKLYQAASHAQNLLEAIVQLEIEELPPNLHSAAVDTPVILLEDGTPPGEGAGTRWVDVVRYWSDEELPGVHRKVEANRLASGAIEIRIELEWLRTITDEDSGQKIELTGFAMPRTWQRPGAAPTP